MSRDRECTFGGISRVYLQLGARASKIFAQEFCQRCPPREMIMFIGSLNVWRISIFIEFHLEFLFNFISSFRNNLSRSVFVCEKSLRALLLFQF